MAVIVRLKLLEDMKRALSSAANKEDVGKLIIDQMKESIAAGLSPVRGEGRFDGYKNPVKYPGILKSKRPVNLYLSGEMLAALKFYPAKGTSVSVGIKGPQGIKANAHNDGTDNIPRRHFLPTDKGDEFTVTITRKIRDLYAQILSDILNR